MAEGRRWSAHVPGPWAGGQNLDGYALLTTEEIQATKALDIGPDGRVGPNPDTYGGI